MADAVASNVIHNLERKKVVHFTNISDGTGESAVAKITKLALNGANAATKIKIHRIIASAIGMTVIIAFDHTADDLIIQIPDSAPVDICYEDFKLVDPASTGGTGDVIFTTVGHTSGDTYAITIEFSW